MSSVKEQYEAYPYPERNPKDEAKRLISGSPSLPQEIDHFIYGGMRDWSKPLRVLVAGGGTGDGLIQLATMMAQFKKPCEITYVDLSKASRKVAEARAKVRKLSNITFVTGSLLDAPDLGEFDYIDCCGVLHHLPAPEEGFRALNAALAPGGGLGFMVYAPYGRSGVYPLQQAFGALLGDLPPKERLRQGKRIFEALPEGHPFKANINVNDHKASEAGFYDLLLHTQDRSYDVTQLMQTFENTGWHLSGFVTQALYDLSRVAKRPEGMGDVEAMAMAEKLNGTIKVHTGYAVKTGGARGPANGRNRAVVPVLKGVRAQQLAQAVAQGKALPMEMDGLKATLSLPKSAAPLIAAINGQRNLNEIAVVAGADPISFGANWGKVESVLAGWGLLLYSGIARQSA
nr:class I SAM-dependent methyltransferase [Roseovarius sp. EL26]